MVLLVVAVLAGLTVPNLATRRARAELRDTADRLQTMARFAHQRAVSRGVDHRLVLLPPGTDGGPGFRVEVVVDDESAAEGYGVVRSGNLKPALLPEGVLLLDVAIANETPVFDGRRMIRFLATGQADAAAVVVAGEADAFTVLVWPNSGRVERVRGVVLQLPNGREDLDA